MDAHQLWHQTADYYSKPEAFRTNLNAAIQALRNVTFAIQNEQHALSDFHLWYAPWRQRLESDAVSRWIKDTRNLVVKQGELEAASTARVRLLTWKDDVLAEVPVAPDISPDVLLKNLPLWDLIRQTRVPAGDLASAVLEIERRWCVPGFENREVLDVLASAYGLLSALVLDAHVHLSAVECIDTESSHPIFRSVHHRAGTIPCMTSNAESRKQRFDHSTQTELVPDLVSLPAADASSFEMAARRYGLGTEDRAAPWQQTDPVMIAEKTVYWSKRVLQRDKSHVRIMFIRDGSSRWHQVALFASSRSEKHILMRLVAQYVDRTGADALIDVAETWTIPAQAAREVSDLNRLQDVRGREEALQVLVATREGILRTYSTPFSRGLFGKIKLLPTQISNARHSDIAYLHPVFKIWVKQGRLTLPDGETVRRWVWEPDPLDTCCCGGPLRFASCCAPVLLEHRDVEALRRQGHEARKRLDPIDVKRFAQAALAQYVIWIRQHTAPTRDIAERLHRDLVAVDIPALDEHVRNLRSALEANHQLDDLVPKLRNISQIVGVPEISVHVVGLAAREMFHAGKQAEATAELDRLGDLDKIRDPLVLLLAARLFDRDDAECGRLLRRAVDGPQSDGERSFYELQLADHYRRSGRRSDALSIVDGVIRRCEGSQDLALAKAFESRWRLTDDASDFRAAKRTLESLSDLESKRDLAVMLIDHGDLEEAEQQLADSLRSGDQVARLLTVDIRLRQNRAEEARDVLNELPRHEVQRRLLLPYAYSIGLVALATEDDGLCDTARSTFREIESEEGELVSPFREMCDTFGRMADGAGQKPSILERFLSMYKPGASGPQP